MIPVILSGGSGTRLWPVSRANYPKQFCDFYDQSFLNNSIARVRRFGEPYIVTVKGMEALTVKAAKELDLSQDHLIFEPLGKNTAAAVALTCHVLKSKGLGDRVVGVFPADHLISDESAFQAAVTLGAGLAEKGEVVTLGIQPRYPATGYGYIEITDEVVGSSDAIKAHAVKGFREKPDLKTAEQFVSTGRYFWNAGMFLFKVDVMVKHLQSLMPELWRQISAIKSDMSNADYQYALCEPQSLDYGIMEKLSRQVCVPCDMGWSDVGSWDELARLSEEFPELRTGTLAHVFNESSTSNYVFSIRPKVIGLVGVQDMIVVDTPDALLIARRGETQRVKNLVDQLREAGQTVATEHPWETRPWGGFEILADEAQFKSKKITVDPGGQLSYQSHAKRAEHWIVIEGEAEVTLNDAKHSLRPGDHIHIPQGSKHRIKNAGTMKLVFVEIQTGTYFGEDDIVRYQDDYGRAP